MISIIIPTYNKPLRLTKCLKNILSCKVNYKIEIIVINDGTLEITNAALDLIINNNVNLDFKVINTNHCGRAMARNIGAENATYDILLFLDDDIIIDADVINMHVKSHVNKSISNYVVHGRVLAIPYLKLFAENDVEKTKIYMQNSKYVELAAYMNDFNNISIDVLNKYATDSKFEKFVKHNVDQNLEYKWVGFVGANTSVKKSFFQTTGGFDSSFGLNWGGEDLEYGYRLHRFYNAMFVYDFTTRAFHLDHSGVDRQQQHKINMKYFREKYNMDESIGYLEKILNGFK